MQDNFKNKYSPILFGVSSVYCCPHGEKTANPDQPLMCSLCMTAVKSGKPSSDTKSMVNKLKNINDRYKKQYPYLMSLYKLLADLYSKTQITVKGVCQNIRGERSYFPIGVNMDYNSVLFVGPKIGLVGDSDSDVSIVSAVADCLRTNNHNDMADDLEMSYIRVADAFNVLFEGYRSLPYWHPIFHGFVIGSGNDRLIPKFAMNLKRLNVSVSEIDELIKAEHLHIYGANKAHLIAIRTELVARTTNRPVRSFAESQLQSFNTNFNMQNPNSSFPAIENGADDVNDLLDNMNLIGENIPDDDEMIPDDDDFIPDDDEFIPEDDELIPEDDELIPEDDELIPDEDEVIPDKEETVAEPKQENLESIVVAVNEEGKVVVTEEDDERV